MSEIDTRLDPNLRDSYLDEVREWLPAFLAGASLERTQPLDDVAELFGLDRAILKRVIAVHLARHDTVRDFVNALPSGLRSPATSSERPRDYSRVLTGGIDWAATSRARATSSPTDIGYVTRSAIRVFNLPENQMLKWVVIQLAKEAELAAPYHSTDAAGWKGEIATVARRTTEARRVAWLRDVPVAPAPHRQMSSLSGSRRAFYRVTVRAAAETLLRYQEPSPEDVTSLLVERWFEPERDWALFEFVVLLRIHRAIDVVSKRITLRTVGIGHGPFAEYSLGPARRVRLWYQRWPSTAGPSEMLDAAAHYNINTAGSRPDIVIEYENGGVSEAVVLELKASKNAEYLASGLLQLLGYLRDRPALSKNRPNGWLVASDNAALSSMNSAGRDLWALRCADIGTAVIRWVQGHSQ